MLLLFVADTAVPPPNWLKLTVTVETGAVLLSPVAELSQEAVTVSPILKAPLVPVAPLTLMCAAVIASTTLPTVALSVPVVVCALPALSVAVTATFAVVVLMPPVGVVYVAVQMPLLFVAVTAVPPPNGLKFTVTVEMVSALLSPVAAVLSQEAVTVSPILKAPPVPVPPLTLMCAAVTVGATLSTVALLVPVVVRVFPASSVAVTTTLTLVVSIEPAVMVKLALQCPALFVAVY